MQDIMMIIGYRLGGRSAEFLMQRLALRVSDDTVLRALKRTVKPSERPLRVVGVDDWAWKRGQSYGTVLVDLERREVADLLPHRSSEQLADWLKRHPEVEVVTRDRYGLYAGGALRGAPQARQVADRFHLLKNLRETVEKDLAHRRRDLAIPITDKEDKVTKIVLAPYVRSRPNPEVHAQNRRLIEQRWIAKKNLFAQVRELYLTGKTASDIVRETGLCRQRVDKWIHCTELPPRNMIEPKPNSPKFFEGYLRERWMEGCHDGRVLLAKLRARGYVGCYSGLARFLARWRDQEPRNHHSQPAVGQRTINQPTSRQISPLVAAALLMKARSLLTPGQAEKIDALKKSCPDFERMRRLAMSFRGIVQAGTPTTLLVWMKKASQSGIYGMRRFVRKVYHDLDAVKNALREPWSNGPVEGHINRLKTLKRQMYGRAGFELLRARLLPMSRGSPLHQN